ncbi:MAG TPA: EAL domain-containing protein, partial [Longilinea sp.]|nr:EAL domain-containing protein [Longilinea sp.]
INLIVTAVLFIASIYSRNISKRIALGWFVIGLAQLLYTLGDISWAYLEIKVQDIGAPSVADVFYILYYFLLFSGVIVFAIKRLRSFELVKRILDISIVMVVAATLYWIYIFSPILSQSGGVTDLQVFISVAYPIGDLFLLFSVLLLIYARVGQAISRSIWYLVLGIMVMGFTDSLYIYQSIWTTYHSGGLIDIGWIISYVLFLLAGISQIAIAKNYVEEDTLPAIEIMRIENISRRLTYLPILWVIGAVVFVLVTVYTTPLIDPNWLFLSLGYVLIMIIFRQVITIHENEGLLSTSRTMLEQTQQQAFRLNETNQKLNHEIQERNKVERELHHFTLHDGLTGLPNKVLLMDRLSHSIQISQREHRRSYSLIFIGLDNFKSINERLGHSCGDLILKEFANRLVACTRSVDTVARFGGDEFVLLIETGSDDNSELVVCRRIFHEMERPFVIKKKDISITCCIGIVEGDPLFATADVVLQNAIIAYELARSKGKSKSEIFKPSMRTSLMQSFMIEEDLKRAITNSELFLNYQPIYLLEDRKIVGMEALVRWQHPQHGSLMPNDFIEIAEKSGLIIPLGQWVLQSACVQLMKWQRCYPDLSTLSISVNITGKQIFSRDFVESIKSCIHASGINPKCLELEITENIFIENQTVVNDLLGDLQRMGVRLSIDDFGTGFSSIGYLKNISVDSIKIDKNFIDDLLRSEKDSQIAKAIVQIAHSLGLEAIAEGIENNEQLEALRSIGCKYGQGYYLSKALGEEELDMLLAVQVKEGIGV